MHSTSILSGAILAATTLIGCGSDTTTTTKTTLNILYPGGAALGMAMNNRIRQFEQDNDVVVNVTGGDWQTVDNLVHGALQGGGLLQDGESANPYKDGNPFDLMELDNGNIAAFNVAGYFEPLDDYLPAGYTSDLIPGQVELFSNNGHLLGLVWNNDSRFFVYRTDIMNQLMAVEPSVSGPPTTMTELRQQCQLIKQHNLARHCFSQEWDSSWDAVCELHYWAYSFGGSFLDTNNNLTMTAPANVAALQFIADLGADGAIDPSSIATQSDFMGTTKGGTGMAPDAQEASFLAGDDAFLLQSTVYVIADLNGAATSTVVNKWKIALSPGGASQANVSLSLPEALAVPKTSKNKALTVKLLQYLLGKEAGKAYAIQTGALPIWQSLYNDADVVAANPAFADMAAETPHIRGLSIATWYGDLVNSLADQVYPILAGINGTPANITPLQALSAAQTALASEDGKP